MRKKPQSPPLSARRRFLAGLGGVVAAPLAKPALGAGFFDAEAFGLAPDSGRDQTGALQAAFYEAARAGQPLMLAGGTYRAENLTLPAGLRLEGVPGRTRIVGGGASPILRAQGADDITLFGLVFDGKGSGPDDARAGLVSFASCTGLALEACAFVSGQGNGLFLSNSAGRIVDCRFSALGRTALFALDSTGLLVSGNSVADCGSGGIRVFRDQSGPDGTIVSANRIAGVASPSGNGQNGNGISVYRADDVLIADNVISDCDFSAIRLNTTNNCIVSGNSCTGCREVAIFSEFAFSGSVIADNIVDSAAAGISITNFDHEGRLAVCSGNIVRNILAASPTNPDTRPYGINAQADTAVTGNVVENVPGRGIQAGWGPYLRDVVVDANVIRDTEVAIGVSVAPGAGHAHLSNNLISGARERAIGAFQWWDMVGDDLITDPDQFDTVTLEGNVAV